MTESQVKGFLSSLPEIRQIGRKYESELKGQAILSFKEAMRESRNPFSAVMDSMREHQAYDEFLKVMNRYGFDNHETWSDVGNRVIRAYAALQIEARQAKVKAEMENARQKIESDTDMFAGKKQMMLDMLQASSAIVESFHSSAPDKAVVKPYMEDIRRSAQGYN
ncbi:MAG: hypothetical protein ACE5EK_04600 [Nitrospinales bacterium]